MKRRDPFLFLWAEFCRADRCLERLRIAHLIEELLG